MNAFGRVVGVLAIVIVVLLITPTTALAHAGGASGATNYQSRILAIEPRLENVHVRVLDFGDRLELRNESGKEVLVVGYSDEPYLRFAFDGIYENTKSPTTYSNRDRYGNVDMPDDVDTLAAPEWQKVASGSLYEWHDHRAHWMSTVDPPQVQGDRDTTHVLYESWTVPVTVDGSSATVTGDLRWIPTPASALPLALALMIASGCLIALVARFGSARIAVIAALMLAVPANALHVLGRIPREGGTVADRLSGFIVGDVAFIAAWVVGVVAVAALLRRHSDAALFAALFSLVVLLLGGGLTDLSAWWNSQVLFVWDSWIARSAIAVTVGSTAVGAVLVVKELRAGEKVHTTSM